MFECFDWEDAGSFCINCWHVFHTLHCVKQTNKRGGGERHNIMSLAAECCRGMQVSVDYCFWLHFTWKRICTDGELSFILYRDLAWCRPAVRALQNVNRCTRKKFTEKTNKQTPFSLAAQSNLSNKAKIWFEGQTDWLPKKPWTSNQRSGLPPSNNNNLCLLYLLAACLTH